MAWTASVVFVEPPFAPAGVCQTELPPEGLCVQSESMPVLFGRQCEYEVAIAFNMSAANSVAMLDVTLLSTRDCVLWRQFTRLNYTTKVVARAEAEERVHEEVYSGCFHFT